MIILFYFCTFREYLYTNAPTDLRSIAYPGGAVALALLLTARLASAYYGQIADCDETYNYWEPLHYLGMYAIFFYFIYRQTLYQIIILDKYYILLQ